MKRLQSVFIHSIFWLGLVFLHLYFFSIRLSFETAVERSLLLLIPQVIIAVVNAHILLPKTFEKKKYFAYALLIIMLVGAAYMVSDYLLTRAVEAGFLERGRDPGRRLNFILGNLSFIFFLTSFSVILFSIAYRSYRIIVRKEQEEAEIVTKNLDAELKFLKSQINPHFLFNALNNVYSLSVEKSEATPDMILRLSDMLRYIIYDCNEEKVALSKEIGYLNNFIALQKLKDEHLNISAELPDEVKDHQIAPMLLIPFLENSFKHSKIEDLEKGWINVTLEVNDSELVFKVENSIPAEPAKKDNQKGIGLENVKRRLELLYPERYTLSIEQTGDRFSILLNLQLDES